ncbi:MAG: radical SAM protein [Bacteroidota bacterium]
MKILLLSPTIYDRNKNLIKQKRVWLPGLTLPYLAALTPEDSEIRILDETTEEIPFDEHWDLVGMTSVGASIIRAWEIADQFRKGGTSVVLGGISATLAGYEPNKDHCDALVLGEADGVWTQVIEDAREKRLKPVYEGTRPDLENTPIPRYDLFNKSKIGFWMPVQASRGCVHSCPFCSVASFYCSTYRTYPLEKVVESVEFIKKLGYNHITIIDDSIGSDISFLEALSKVLIPLKIKWMSQCTLTIAEHPEVLEVMARSGCTMLSIGIESVLPESLQSINKHFNHPDKYKDHIAAIRKFGIDISTEMMIGLDGDDDGIYKAFYDFIMHNKISVPRIFIVTPIPGTPLYDDWLKEGRIFDFNVEHYTGSQLVFHPKGMTREGLEDNYWQLYERLFTVPAILSRYFRSRPARGLLSNIFALGANFHYRKHIQKRIPPGIV